MMENQTSAVGYAKYDRAEILNFTFEQQDLVEDIALNSYVPCCNNPGDADSNDSVNIADVTFIISMLFSGGNPPECRDEGDANGDNKTNISDVVFIVSAIFIGGDLPICGSSGL